MGLRVRRVNLALGSTITLSKFSNFPNELNENDELSEYELSGSDCTQMAHVRLRCLNFDAEQCISNFRHLPS